MKNLDKLYASGRLEKTFDPDSGEFLKILPHQKTKLVREIHKTALDAEMMVPFEYSETPDLATLRQDGYRIVGLEQDDTSVILNEYSAPEKIALLLGEEVHGLTNELRESCDDLIEIPMVGKKESFNVSVACGIALYGLNYS